MSQIITITANPAVDISTSVDKIAPFTKLRCEPAKQDPGGGGINVARVVKRLGGDVLAIYPTGGTTGESLRRLMEREDVTSLAVPATEETRESFTVFEGATKQQYRFVLPGAPLRESEWQECLRQLSSVGHRPDFVVASGSLPPGVPDDFFGRIVCIAKEMGAKIVVDTSGPALKSALKEGCYLIKPNLREFRELTDTSAEDDAALISAGRNLIDRGFVEIIALSLGAFGAMLITRDRAWRADGLPIKPASVVGAGDSFVGALVWSLAEGNELVDALRYGVAAGSAALLNPGTELCRSEDVKRLTPQVIIEQVPAWNVG